MKFFLFFSIYFHKNNYFISPIEEVEFLVSMIISGKERIDKKNTAKLEFIELGYRRDMKVGKRENKESLLQ